MQEMLRTRAPDIIAGSGRLITGLAWTQAWVHARVIISPSTESNQSDDYRVTNIRYQ